MELEPIIQVLRTRCAALFANRVAGAAHFKLLQESANLPVPCAYVIPLDDTPGEAKSQNSVRQDLQDSFAVVIALDNRADEKGQAATQSVDSARAALWRALLGWRPTDRYDGITYDGGHLLALDRARLWYQFEFSAAMEIDPDDGYQQLELDALPAFKGLDVKVDVIDPIAQPRPGPDGRVEFVVPIPKTGDLPT